MSVSEIVHAIDVGQSTVSHHLALLGQVGFVVAKHRGARTFYTVNERCVERFPSAAELVMGRVPRPGWPGRHRCRRGLMRPHHEF
jgi:DNA-binding transcriptional ArsR family regulator